MPTMQELTEKLKNCRDGFAPVVPYEKEDGLLLMDFTAANTALSDEILCNTDLFSKYVEEQLQSAGAKYGIGGYDEHRTIYSRSTVFDTASEEPRRLHLGPEGGRVPPLVCHPTERSDRADRSHFRDGQVRTAPAT